MILEHKKEVKKSTKIILGVLLLGLIIAGFLTMKFYSLYFAPNINKSKGYIYVKTGSNYVGFLHDLLESGYLKNEQSFEEAAGKMNLAEKVLNQGAMQ
jgi:UPF0755 protein